MVAHSSNSSCAGCCRPLCRTLLPSWGTMWLAAQLRHPGCRDRLLASFRRLLPTSLRRFSPSAGRQDSPAPSAGPPHFMFDYLVSSCGLSTAEALRASEPLARLRSPEQPDAVLQLLRRQGMGDADIKRAVLRGPRVLAADAKMTLEPRMRALEGAGLSRSEVGQLISTSPRLIFAARDVPHRVEFWRSLLGTNQNLLKTMKRFPNLLRYSLDGAVTPRFSLLRTLGVPDDRMRELIRRRPRFMSANPDRIKSLVEQVKSLGFSPGSPMFVEALSCVANLSRSTFNAKSKLLRGFGWTQAELISAIQKFPHILVYSEKKICATMGFLLNEAGCDPSYIAFRPTLLGLSMEKRLKPRFYMLQALKSKGLPSGRRDLMSAMVVTDDNFIRLYITPYSGEHPELLEAYHAMFTKHAKANTDSALCASLTKPRYRHKTAV